MRKALLIGVVLLFSFVSTASAYSLGDFQSDISIEHHVLDVDSSNIPGEDYISIPGTVIPGTDIKLDEDRMYRQISEHVYYSPAKEEILGTRIMGEATMIKYGDLEIV